MQKLMPTARAKREDDLISEPEYDAIFLREMFLSAAKEKASDIHIEHQLDADTYEVYLQIRFRIHGDLHTYRVLDDDAESIRNITGRIKRLARANLQSDEISQSRAFILKATKARYRLEISPTPLGEQFVFRVIETDAVPRIEDCNLAPDTESAFLASLKEERGLIVISGSVGSGKSTTLQAGLMHLDRGKKKVLSIEDPVERMIPQVVQLEIGENFGWADAIKSAVRSNPDVMLIGEIRDRESAELALEASNIGHLVLTTLHCNDAASIVNRLIEMGVRRELIAEQLLFATGQTLRRRLCPSCRTRTSDGFGFHQGSGCKQCRNGIIGRIPLVEFIHKPNYASIMNFKREDFRQMELKLSFEQEAIRMVSEGLIDRSELEIWAPGFVPRRGACRIEPICTTTTTTTSISAV